MMRRLPWTLAAGLIVAISVGWPDHGAAQTADDMMRSALASALQANGKDAVAALHTLDPASLAERYAPTRTCMLERLDARRPPAISPTDSILAKLLAVYHEYWLRSLRAEHAPADNDAWLLAMLNAKVVAQGSKPAANLDELEPALETMIGAHGYHSLLGVTSPLRELMLWKTETEKRYDVSLPAGTQPVTVVFMDHFASLGWAGFATCDRHHSGGWTKPDRLYAVRSAYDTTTEDFRVSYLAHEAQHFADNHRFPRLQRQDELEYRAKLVELAVGKATIYDLLDNFTGNVSDDPSVPHSYANGRLVRELARKLSLSPSKAPAWHDATVARINAASRSLLRDDTRRLEKAPAGSTR